MSDAPSVSRPDDALKRCDLHLHTRHSRWRRGRVLRARDSYSDPVEVYERAKAAGMDQKAADPKKGDGDAEAGDGPEDGEAGKGK